MALKNSSLQMLYIYNLHLISQSKLIHGALYNNHGWKFGVKFPHELAIGQLFLPGDQVGVEHGR
jgi:hypothetical protein